MKTILWMMIGTFLCWLGLSELGTQLARGYTNISDSLWVWKMLAVYSFCGMLVSPIPYSIGAECAGRRYNFYYKAGIQISIIVGGFFFFLFVLAIAKGGGRW